MNYKRNFLDRIKEAWARSRQAWLIMGRRTRALKKSLHKESLAHLGLNLQPILGGFGEAVGPRWRHPV